MTKYWYWESSLYRKEKDEDLEYFESGGGWCTSFYPVKQFCEFAEEVSLADIIDSGFLRDLDYRIAILGELV